MGVIPNALHALEGLAKHTAAAFERVGLSLLPIGKIWERMIDGGVGDTIGAISEEQSRGESEVLRLLDEADPRTAVDTIDDWLRILDIPGPCDTAPVTLAEKQAAAHAKFISRGGQTRNYIINQVGAPLGYVVTIFEPYTEFFRSEQGKSEDRLYDYTWAFVFFVNADESGALVPRDIFECSVNEAKPAHTRAIFFYTP